MSPRTPPRDRQTSLIRVLIALIALIDLSFVAATLVTQSHTFTSTAATVLQSMQTHIALARDPERRTWR